MIHVKNALRDIAVRLAVALVSVLAVADLSMRVFPSTNVSLPASGDDRQTFFMRLEPSRQWQNWFKEIQEKRAAAIQAMLEAKRIAEEEAVKDASVSAQQGANAEAQPKGDVRVIRLDGLDYQLLGVFASNTSEALDGNEMFAVLDSKQGESMKIKLDQVIASYKVAGFTSRSVVFDSLGDERVVTLWLFGKGPR